MRIPQFFTEVLRFSHGNAPVSPRISPCLSSEVLRLAHGGPTVSPRWLFHTLNMPNISHMDNGGHTVARKFRMCVLDNRFCYLTYVVLQWTSSHGRSLTNSTSIASSFRIKMFFLTRKAAKKGFWRTTDHPPPNRPESSGLMLKFVDIQYDCAQSKDKFPEKGGKGI